MNILLVDDDYYIVEAVKTMIDWEKTGIDGIYTALDASSARQIMENIPIQIILLSLIHICPESWRFWILLSW